MTHLPLPAGTQPNAVRRRVSDIVVGPAPVRIVDAARRRPADGSAPSPLPPFRDGRSGRRIVARLRADLLAGHPA